MTRRIALAILVTVWAILIAGCATAYLTIRWVLIDQLDRSLETRASALPELTRLAGSGNEEEARPSPAPAVTGGLSTPRGDRYLIRDATGKTLSPPAGGLADSNVRKVTAHFTTLADGKRMRSLTLEARVRGPGGAVAPVSIVFQGSAEALFQTLGRLAVSLTLFGITAGLLTALVALWVSRRALRPLHATADVIGTIDSSNLHRRIEVAQLPPELIPMATRLNEMLARLERDYAHRQQFLADASHELRTPVAALVTAAEVALRHPREAQAYRRALESCLGDARLLRRLVERLMEQCRADTLTHDEKPQQIELVPLLDDCADQAAVIAAERQVAVERSLPERFWLTTQPRRLRSIVTNLLSNAVEYNRPGGSVELVAEVVGESLRISVRDTGPGIEPGHIPHLFEPFYRADKARSLEVGHLGLGLSLVHSHVKAMGGEIEVESTPGKGTTFEVRIPLGDQPWGMIPAPSPPAVRCAGGLS
jgi:signal transduction histidine kinase